jgi:hypothetical protein
MQSALKDKLNLLGDRVFPGMDASHVITLYLLVPLSIGAVLGWYRAGYAAEYPLAVSMFEWLTNFFALWVAFDLGTRLIAFLLKPWTPPLWIMLGLGGISGVAVSRPLRVVIRDVAGGLAPEGKPDIAFPPDLVWQEYVFAYASVVAVPILIWVVVNYIYAEALGVPRYGYLSKKSSAGRRLRESGSPAGVEQVEVPEFATRLSAGTDQSPTGRRSLPACLYG